MPSAVTIGQSSIEGLLTSGPRSDRLGPRSFRVPEAHPEVEFAREQKVASIRPEEGRVVNAGGVDGRTHVDRLFIPIAGEAGQIDIGRAQAAGGPAGEIHVLPAVEGELPMLIDRVDVGVKGSGLGPARGRPVGVPDLLAPVPGFAGKRPAGDEIDPFPFRREERHVVAEARARERRPGGLRPTAIDAPHHQQASVGIDPPRERHHRRPIDLVPVRGEYRRAVKSPDRRDDAQAE